MLGGITPGHVSPIRHSYLLFEPPISAVYVRVSSGSAWKGEEPDQRYFARRRLVSFMMVLATTALTEDTTQIRNQKTTMRLVTVIPTALAETVRSISVNTRTD